MPGAVSTPRSANISPLVGKPLQMVSASGSFAVPPSGAEDPSKIYARSFQSEVHLSMIVSDAQREVDCALEAAA